MSEVFKTFIVPFLAVKALDASIPSCITGEERANLVLERCEPASRLNQTLAHLVLEPGDYRFSARAKYQKLYRGFGRQSAQQAAEEHRRKRERMIARRTVEERLTEIFPGDVQGKDGTEKVVDSDTTVGVKTTRDMQTTAKEAKEAMRNWGKTVSKEGVLSGNELWELSLEDD